MGILKEFYDIHPLTKFKKKKKYIGMNFEVDENYNIVKATKDNSPMVANEATQEFIDNTILKEAKM